MGILEELGRAETWRSYAAEREARVFLPEREKQALAAWIEMGRYVSLAARMQESDFCFPPPIRREINKLGTGKKRIVYAFGTDESYMLKLMAHLLQRYDAVIPGNCYSFRRSTGARQAVRRLSATPGMGELWCYKLDVRNYFNSIDVNQLLPMLRRVLDDDVPLYAFLERLLCADVAVIDGAVVSETRGAMAGVPVSPFLANLYLADADAHFAALGVPYARYSDDIVLFAPTEEELTRHRAYLLELLAQKGLAVNEDKAGILPPGAPWEFLGVRYADGKIDLSRATCDKLKGKVRRKARALYRWRRKKSADEERAMRAFAQWINRKLFANPRADELTWARWFFPLLTTDAGLKEMDAYIRAYMRYLATGRFAKANYNVSYETLKQYGLRSLVHEYYSDPNR